jgi:Tat protein translocase TatB subunit
MFDIGFWELVVIAIIALLVIGPEQLPVFAHETGIWIGKLKRLIHNARRELEAEFHLLNQKPYLDKLDDLDGLLNNAPDRINDHKKTRGPPVTDNKPDSE